MRSYCYLSLIFLLINYVSAVPGTANYVAPSNSTRVLRQSENPKNLEDVLAERPEESEDVGPLGEVQLDVEEEDIGDSAQPKMRVRRGYNTAQQQKPQQQQKSKYGGGGQSNSKYGGSSSSRGSKYGGARQQPQQQHSQYGQQSTPGKYGAEQRSRGGY
ncbi:hypothetical protein L5515_011604 [Caenorhabditis briggsae]|uniref:Uncharacterized protein n=1 Tax=Caenorhabditis briggsae TaxID=6238 RepID=A0AAE9JFR1_CAEBR|nr:hypothetical protein L5515_011604 [Caenorhabditis briggsae]